MKRSYFPTILLCIMAVLIYGLTASVGQSQPSTAASGGREGGIAVLDLVRVFNECEQIKDLNEMIRKKTEEVSQEAAQRKKVIEDKQVELSAFQPGKSDHEARRKDLVRLNIEANVWLKATEEEVETQKFEWTRIIYEKSVKAAADLAQQRGIAAVIQRVDFKPDEIESNVQALRRMIQQRTVIYHAPDLDLTDEVIRRLDTEYKTAGGKKQLAPPSQPPSP